MRGVGGSRKHDIMREAKGKDYIITLWTAAGDGALPGIDSRFSTVKPSGTVVFVLFLLDFVCHQYLSSLDNLCPMEL